MTSLPSRRPPNRKISRGVDAVKLASVTGLRREDPARLTWAGVREFTLVNDAAEKSVGKHRDDTRGTFATRMTTTTDFVGEEIAETKGWSPDEVRRIRTIYVDDHARNVALGRQIAGGIVNPEPRKRSEQRQVVVSRV